LGFLYYRSGVCLSDFFRGGISLPRFGKPKLRIHRQGTPTKSWQLDRRADEILAKVHKHGADSITEEERKILDDYSRRLRQKLR
jgi:hypothetical protein